MKEIFLDYASTSPVFKEVIKVMKGYMEEDFGNPSSLHFKGERAFNAMSESRKKIALELGCKPEEIIFTSGATESNNLALNTNKKILIAKTEHPSVYESAINKNCKIIPVDKEGFVDLNFIKKEANENSLVSVMQVNNIFGTIQDIKKIAKICKERGALFHTDCVQSFGKLKLDIKDIDMLSASAHKIGGPKGIGFLYVKKGVNVNPILLGGGQEKNLRSGTENIAGIIGFVKALEIYKKTDFKKIEKFKNRIITEIKKIGKINGSEENRIFNNIHASFPGIDREELVLKLSSKGIYVSTGSACDSKKKKEDIVLEALGLKEERINSGIRITLGPGNTEKDIDIFLKELKKLVS